MRSGSRILISWAAFCSFVTSGTAQIGSPAVPSSATSENGKSVFMEDHGETKPKRPYKKTQDVRPQNATPAGKDYTPSPEIMDALKRIRERAVPSK